MFRFFCCETEGKNEQGLAFVESITALTGLQRLSQTDGSSSSDEIEPCVEDGMLELSEQPSDICQHEGRHPESEGETTTEWASSSATKLPNVQDMQVQLSEMNVKLRELEVEVSSLRMRATPAPTSNQFFYPTHPPHTSSGELSTGTAVQVPDTAFENTETARAPDSLLSLSSETSHKPNADFTAASPPSSVRFEFSNQSTAAPVTSEPPDKLDRCSSEDLLSPDVSPSSDQWRQSTSPAHTCHVRAKGDGLETRLFGAVLLLNALEQEINVAMNASSGSITTERRRELLSSCNAVYGQLSDLAGDALESSYERSVPGAMGVFENTNAQVERVARFLQMLELLC